MLGLSRKHGEGIYIGNDTYIKVLRIQGGQVIIGIMAPDEVKIARDELVGPEHPLHQFVRNERTGEPNGTRS